MSRRRYSLQFKDQACQLAVSPDYTPLRAARQLGVHPYSLRTWMKQRKIIPTTPANANSSVDSNDINVLRQQLKAAQAKVRELEIDVTILKKATAFFAKENPR